MLLDILSQDEGIQLKAGSKVYDGWTDIVVSKSMNNLCGGFTFNCTEKYPSKLEKWEIQMGDECSVLINGKTILKGYIDDININYTKDSHTIQVTGRDKTCDLVDCTNSPETAQWLNSTLSNSGAAVSLKSILEKICKDYGVPVKIDNDPSVTTACNTIITNYKETYSEASPLYEFIAGACKQKAVLPLTYGDGKLTITRAGLNGICSDSLEVGVNILEGNLEQSNKERFKTYIAKGQGIGLDGKSLESTANIKSTFADTIIKRDRYYTVIINQACDENTCSQYLKWESAFRAGQSRKVHYTVQGWTQKSGNIWDINKMLKISDKILNIDKSLLIYELEFRFNQSSGTTTTLGLVHPDTYKLVSSVKNMKTTFDKSIWS